MAKINYDKNVLLDKIKSQVNVNIKVSPQEYAKVFEQAAENYASKLSMPGFRKGKVPLATVKASYLNEISEKAYNMMLEQIVKDVVSTSEQKPISSVRVNLEDVEKTDSNDGLKDASFLFFLSYAYKIAPKIPDISTIKIKRTEPEIKDDEITESMGMILSNLNKGKIATEDKTKDSKKTEAISNSDETEKEDLEEVKNEENEEHEISDEWTDEKVKMLKIDKINTVEELKELVKSELIKQKQYEGELEYRAKMLDEIIKMSEITLPQIIVEDMLAQQEIDFEERIKKLGFEYDTYLEERKIKLEDLRKEWGEIAKADLARELLLSEYALSHNIVPTELELENAIKNADENLKAKYDRESLRQYMTYVLQNNLAFTKIYSIVSDEIIDDVNEIADLENEIENLEEVEKEVHEVTEKSSSK